MELERLERLEDVREHWDRLAEGAGHPFATWEWIESRWRHFGDGRELYLFACRAEDGEVVGILPMYVAAKRPVRMARFLGYGSLASPLCAPEDRAAVAAALRRTIGSGRGRCRLLYAEKLPGEQGWGEPLGGRLIATQPDPVIEFQGRSWDEYLAGLKSKVRENVRYNERRLKRDHEVSFRLTEDPDRLDADMDLLFRLHDVHWGAESTGVFDGAGARMHREIAARMLERGWLRLWIEEIGGEPAAVAYGFRFAGSEWGYQLGRDPRPEWRAAGSVLVAHVIREACNAGAEDFRLLEGGAPFKMRLATDDYRAETRLLGDGMAARMAGFTISRIRGAADPVRGRLTRIVERALR